MLKVRVANRGVSVKALIIASVSLFALLFSTNFVRAAGETVAAPLSATTEMKTTTTLSGIQINGTDDSTVPVKLLVTSGTLSMSTTTGLTFTGSPTGSTLYFSGTRSNVNAALATLSYTRNTVGSDTLEISLVSSGEVFFGENGHLYEYVSSTQTWGGAKSAAEGRTKYGASGYLATITSQSENDFVSARLANAGWMGASDSSVEGAWRWVTGPENGTQFCSGNNPCNSVSGRYTNWNSGEPNDSSSNEDCGQFLSGGSGKWNDLPCSGTTLPGYVVEYGAPGNMPTVAAANVAITTVDSINPVTPVVSSISSPTTDATPAVTWTASSDAGTGLRNPAYTVEWSTSSAFTVTSGSSTTNSLSLAPSSNLPDGTWYFRVKATDVAGNVATSAVSNAVVIDTTAPTVPGDPTADDMWTNDTTPAFIWDASVDAGVGLAFIAYGVEWSQSSSFFGLGGTAGITENSYTIPDNLSMVDGTWYFRVKAIDSLGYESAWSDAAVVHIDTTIPTIDDVTVGAGADLTEKMITWTTDKDTSSRVSYGPTLDLAIDTVEEDTVTRVQNHSVVLEDLAPCSKYYFTVSSVDVAGNAVTSTEQSFMTGGCAGLADVLAFAEATLTTGSGGTVGLETISIAVPAAFSSTTANFQIKRIERGEAVASIGNPQGTLPASSMVYDVKALQNGSTNLTSFDRPIYITLQYSDNEISDLDEGSLVIYRWDEADGWTLLSDCTVDKAANTVTCATTHFSTFALYGHAKPVTSSKGLAYSSTDLAYENTSQVAEEEVRQEVVRTPGPGADARDQTSERTSGQSIALWWWLAPLIVGGIIIVWFIVARRRRDNEETAEAV